MNLVQELMHNAGGKYISRLKFYMEMAKGETLFRQADLERIFNRVFSIDGKTPLTFGDIKTPLTIFTSDLAAGLPQLYSQNTKPHETLGAAMAKSCSMPLLFSSFLQKETDGGICGNLPVDYFFREHDDQTRILALSFEQAATPADNLLSYLMSLLSNSLDTSVRQARQQTEDVGGAVHVIETNIETFDFKKSRKLLDEAAFELETSRLEKNLKSRLRTLFANLNYATVIKTRFGRDDVSRIFDIVNRAFPVTWGRSTKIYVDKNARILADVFENIEDERIYVQTIEPVSDRVVAFRIGLPKNFDAHFGLAIDIKDIQGLPQKFDAYINKNPENGSELNRVIVFLDEPVPKNHCPLRVQVRLQGDVFEELRRGGEDRYKTINISAVNIDLHEFVIATVAGSNHELTDISALPEDQRRTIYPNWDAISLEWTPGEPIPTDDVKALITPHLQHQLAPQTQFYGWKTADLSIGKRTGFVAVPKRRGGLT